MVLEAWQDAEKVWFPVVWEEKKDPSNVVDYDIHWEITIDTSSVFNANNDTTTGMATVIPWVNAPKLIANTSIIWWLGGGFWYSVLSSRASGYFDEWIHNIEIKTFTISDEAGDLKFTQWASWIIIPKTATYHLHIDYPKWWTNFKFDSYVKQNSETIHTYNWPYSYSADQFDEFFADLTKWSSLWMAFTFINNNTISVDRPFTINIQSVS